MIGFASSNAMRRPTGDLHIGEVVGGESERFGPPAGRTAVVALVGLRR